MVAMLGGVERPRRNRDREAFQGPGLHCVVAHKCGQNGGAGTGEDRGENSRIRRQLDRDIQIGVRNTERVQSLDEGSPRPGALAEPICPRLGRRP